MSVISVRNEMDATNDFETTVAPVGHSPDMRTPSALAALSALGLTVLLATLSIGCGGSVEDTGGPPTTTTPSVTSPPTYAASEVVTTKASCGAPDSAVTTYSSASELTSLLVGSWMYCPSTTTDVLPFGAAGAQFTSDGEFRWLVLDESGTLTSGVSPLNSNATSLTPATDVPPGGDTEGAKMTYDFEPFTDDPVNNVSGQINVWYADKSVMPTRATFEGSPRRMALQDFDGIFLYIGP